MKKQFHFFKIFAVFLLMFAPSSSAAETKSPTPNPSFKASSLWGVRRGPKAPKTPFPKPADARPADENAEKAKELNRYYEEKTKGLYGGPEPGSPRSEISMTSGSTEECKAQEAKK